ncbi:hypothetical protein [Gimesia sp.]|uniref:hypothetical protein n=1 Tax=Gimesia sp. TaxID=2024833 RepID=UPI003A92E1A9
MEEKLSTQDATEPPPASQSGMFAHQSPGLTNLARPHMFLFEPVGPRVPLSVYLEGREAVRKYSGKSKTKNRYTTRIQILGEAKFQDLECTTVRIETIDANGKPRSRTDLWLAKKRNLIPIRRLNYSYRESKDLPCSESLVKSWQEIHPGIWFPEQTLTERFDSIILRRELIQVTSWRNDYQLETIELNPVLPDDTFTKLELSTEAK